MNSETTFTNAEDFEDFCYMNLETENTEIIVEFCKEGITSRGSYNSVSVEGMFKDWDLCFMRYGGLHEDDSYIQIEPERISISKELEEYVWFSAYTKGNKELNFRLKRR